MENAAKALQMAAGILMSVMVLGLIVYGYNHLSATKQVEEDALKDEQAISYNKSIEGYNRELMGTELISLSNKVDDHRKKYPIIEGYPDISLEITYIDSSKFPNYAAGASDIAEKHKEIEKEIREYITKPSFKWQSPVSSKKYSLREVEKMPDKLFKQEMGDDTKTKDDVPNYSNYKDLVDEQTDFSRRYFTCEEWKYDANGRIEKITFKMKPES